MTVEIFVRIVWTVFAKKNQKKLKNGGFLAIFGLTFGYVSHIPAMRI